MTVLSVDASAFHTKGFRGSSLVGLASQSLSPSTLLSMAQPAQTRLLSRKSQRHFHRSANLARSRQRFRCPRRGASILWLQVRRLGWPGLAKSLLRRCRGPLRKAGSDRVQKAGSGRLPKGVSAGAHPGSPPDLGQVDRSSARRRCLVQSDAVRAAVPEPRGSG